MREQSSPATQPRALDLVARACETWISKPRLSRSHRQGAGGVPSAPDYGLVARDASSSPVVVEGPPRPSGWRGARGSGRSSATLAVALTKKKAQPKLGSSRDSLSDVARASQATTCSYSIVPGSACAAVPPVLAFLASIRLRMPRPLVSATWVEEPSTPSHTPAIWSQRDA